MPVKCCINSVDLSQVDLGFRSGFDPSGLDRPGRLPHQQGLSEARLGYQDESPQLGPRGPGE